MTFRAYRALRRARRLAIAAGCFFAALVIGSLFVVQALHKPPANDPLFLCAKGLHVVIVGSGYTARHPHDVTVLYGCDQ